MFSFCMWSPILYFEVAIQSFELFFNSLNTLSDGLFLIKSSSTAICKTWWRTVSSTASVYRPWAAKLFFCHGTKHLRVSDYPNRRLDSDLYCLLWANSDDYWPQQSGEFWNLDLLQMGVQDFCCGHVNHKRLRIVATSFSRLGIWPMFAISSIRQRTWTGSLPPYTSSAFSHNKLNSCV